MLYSAHDSTAVPEAQNPRHGSLEPATTSGLPGDILFWKRNTVGALAGGGPWVGAPPLCFSSEVGDPSSDG